MDGRVARAFAALRPCWVCETSFPVSPHIVLPPRPPSQEAARTATRDGGSGQEGLAWA